MPQKLDSLKYKQTINSKPAEIYRAFTTPTGLSEWLCNKAYIQPGNNSSFYLWWQNGYYVCGEYTQCEPDIEVGFTWFGKDEPGPSTVRVNIKEKDNGSQLTLTHLDLGTGKNWKKTRSQIDKGWQDALDNLSTVLEEGQDKRQSNRPMMGITGVEPVSEEIMKKYNLPKSKGLLLSGVINGMGAQNAGLQAGDVLLKLDNKKLNQEQDLLQLIGKHKAGDTVKVIFFRQGEKRETELTFTEKLHYDIPQNPGELTSQVDAMYKQLTSQIELMLKGVSEEKASSAPDQDEWNIKQVLAHLISSEKDTHSWICSLLDDRDCLFEFHENRNSLLNSIIAVCPTINGLIKDLKRNTAETVAYLNNLDENFLDHKRSYNRLGEFLLSTTFHYQDHIDQIKKIIENHLP